MIRTSTLDASLRSLAWAVVLWCSAAAGAPPQKLPSPPELKQRGPLVKVEQRQEGGGFFYFAAALLTLGATGLAIQAILSRPLRSSSLLKSAWRARFSGGFFAMLAGSAFILVFGSPNGKIAGAVWLIAVFGVCGSQLALRATEGSKNELPHSEAQR